MNPIERIKEIDANNNNEPKYCGTVDDLPIGMIEEEHVSALLRPAQKDTEEYKNLVHSIKEVGVLSPIAIRRGLVDHNKFIIIDGVQRFNAAKDAGRDDIKVNYFPNISDATEIMALQIQGNIHRVDTTPAQYGNQLKRMMARNPLWTQQQLADAVNITQGKVSYLLKLVNNLNKDLHPLVDSGKIKLMDALKISELPSEEQADYAERAQTTDSEAFMMDLIQRLAEIRNERKGLPKPEWEPRAKLRTLDEIKEAINDCDNEDMKNAFLWCISLDEESCNQQREKREEQERISMEKKAAKEAEKEAKAGQNMPKRPKSMETQVS